MSGFCKTCGETVCSCTEKLIKECTDLREAINFLRGSANRIAKLENIIIQCRVVLLTYRGSDAEKLERIKELLYEKG